MTMRAVSICGGKVILTFPYREETTGIPRHTKACEKGTLPPGALALPSELPPSSAEAKKAVRSLLQSAQRLLCLSCLWAPGVGGAETLRGQSVRVKADLCQLGSAIYKLCDLRHVLNYPEPPTPPWETKIVSERGHRTIAICVTDRAVTGQ